MSYKFIFYFLLFNNFLLTNGNNQHPTHALTYKLSSGQFGDHLLIYCVAKWLSFKSGIPLLYKPFCYSSKLALDNLEIPYSEKNRKNFSYTKSISAENYSMPSLPNKQTLFISNFQPRDTLFSPTYQKMLDNLHADILKNPLFKKK